MNFLLELKLNFVDDRFDETEHIKHINDINNNTNNSINNELNKNRVDSPKKPS